MAKIKNTDHNKYWLECGSNAYLKTAWQFFKC